MANPRAVLCDDDALVRSVIARIMEEAGYEVVGEADSPDQAVALVEHLGADIVVLDLALRAGHGEHLLQELVQRHPDTRTVVFSAYIANPSDLIAAGANAVIEKPDFGRLEEVVATLRTAPESLPDDRRREAPRAIPTLPPPTAVTVSGFEPWTSFLAAAECLVNGDAIIAVDVLPNAAIADAWDDVFRVDYRVAIGRAAGATRRELDRITLSPAGVPVMLVIAGHPEAPSAVFERVDRVWRREIASGVPVGAFGHVDRSQEPTALLDRVIEAVTRGAVSIESPLRMV